ncbi:MAG: NAD(+) synthase [Bacteroidales bacterium]|jgi:NAD+ synthetase|nr:NAD(+) synthase [Bacteroidales bacterium]
MNKLEQDIRDYFLDFILTDAKMEMVVQKMQSEITSYITNNNLKSLILGISGGIDSAFAAALLRPVCDQINIPLIGRSITIETNKKDEIERSILVGENFCHDFKYLNSTSLYKSFQKKLPHTNDSHLSKLRMGNCKARMRMIVLYDLAQLHSGLVISTDNFTEYLTGFWTLHGDVGDYAPFCHLWKTEIYFASKLIAKKLDSNSKKALQLCIDAIPTDGLGISNSDLDQLGVPTYEKVDNIFLKYFKGDKTLENHTLIQRYIHSFYKRKNPIILHRSTFI